MSRACRGLMGKPAICLPRRLRLPSPGCKAPRASRQATASFNPVASGAVGYGKFCTWQNIAFKAIFYSSSYHKAVYRQNMRLPPLPILALKFAFRVSSSSGSSEYLINLHSLHQQHNSLQRCVQNFWGRVCSKLVVVHRRREQPAHNACKAMSFCLLKSVGTDIRMNICIAVDILQVAKRGSKRHR